MRLPFPATPRAFLLLFAAASALILAAALLAQYGFGLHPCHLCLLQRYPYAGVILAGLAGAFLLSAHEKRRHALLACALLFALGAGIAAYHTGVEYGVIPGPSSCTNDSTGEMSLEEMRKQIMNAPLVSCDQPMARVLGVSLAGWNALLYAFLMILGSYAYKRTRLHNHPPAL